LNPDKAIRSLRSALRKSKYSIAKAAEEIGVSAALIYRMAKENDEIQELVTDAKVQRAKKGNP
jgi:hypothetical protein